MELFTRLQAAASLNVTPDRFDMLRRRYGITPAVQSVSRLREPNLYRASDIERLRGWEVEILAGEWACRSPDWWQYCLLGEAHAFADVLRQTPPEVQPSLWDVLLVTDRAILVTGAPLAEAMVAVEGAGAQALARTRRALRRRRPGGATGDKGGR